MAHEQHEHENFKTYSVIFIVCQLPITLERWIVVLDIFI